MGTGAVGGGRWLNWGKWDMYCLINRKAKAEASEQINFYQSV